MMSEEPDYSLEIDGHRYELRGPMLVAERYASFLGSNRPVELWIGPVIKGETKEALTASFLVIGPRGGTYPVSMSGLTEWDMQEYGMRMGDARRHIEAVDAWRKKEYGGA